MTAKQYIKAGVITREAECPHGHGVSREFLGVSENGWLFRCDKRYGTRHNFVAAPDTKAPSTVEGVAKWMTRHQRVALKKH